MLVTPLVVRIGSELRENIEGKSATIASVLNERARQGALEAAQEGETEAAVESDRRRVKKPVVFPAIDTVGQPDTSLEGLLSERWLTRWLW